MRIMTTHTHTSLLHMIYPLLTHDQGQGPEFVRTECFHYFHRPCVWYWLKYVEEERERAVEEASRNRVRMSEDQLPQFECPVCREALQYAEEWLQWEDIPELKKGCDQTEEVGHLIGSRCKCGPHSCSSS